MSLPIYILIVLLAINAVLAYRTFTSLEDIYCRLEEIEDVVFASPPNAVGGSIHFGADLFSEGVEDMAGAIGVIKSVGGTITGTPQFTDAAGAVVPVAGLNPQWASADTTKVTVGAADPTTGASVITGVAPTGSNPDGSPATVAVTCTGTNADGTTDVLTGAVQVADDAVGGSIAFA